MDDRQRIVELRLDRDMIRWNADIQREIDVAIFDLKESNRFRPLKPLIPDPTGPYHAHLAIRDRQLLIDLFHEGNAADAVDRIALDPEYTYNPKKNFQQGTNDKILRIPPGPNGPVGSVWIALSKPTYGIHGTPDPSKIGKTNSNGCIRLTNWDARELASNVRKGVTVEFVE